MEMRRLLQRRRLRRAERRRMAEKAAIIGMSCDDGKGSKVTKRKQMRG